LFPVKNNTRNRPSGPTQPEAKNEIGEMITAALAHVVNTERAVAIWERMRTAAFATLEVDWSQKIKEQAP
jgi:hypothetical protein